MNPPIKQKFLQIVERHEELNVLLSDPSIIESQGSFRKLSIELAEITPIVETFHHYRKIEQELADAHVMLADSDSAIQDMGKRPEIAGYTANVCRTVKSSLQNVVVAQRP